MDQTPTLFEKKGFGGSFTDNVYSNNMALCYVNDNFLVNNNEKLYVRPGSTVLYPAVTTLTSSGYKLNRFIKYRDERQMFVGVGPKLYYDTGSGWTNKQGPGSHDAFVGGTDSHYWSYAEWNGFLFMTHSKSTSKPIKVYTDGSSNLQLRTAGLPAVATTANYVEATLLASAITLANYLRADLSTHFSDTTVHKAADSTSNALIGSAATDLASLLALTTSLLKAYENHLKDITANSSYHYDVVTDTQPGRGVIAPRTTAESIRLVSTATPETLLEATRRLNDVRAKTLSHWVQLDVHIPSSYEFSYVGNALHSGSNTAVNSSALLGYSNGPLIKLNLSTLYAYANLCKSKFNAHIAADGSGPDLFTHKAADTTNTISTADATTDKTLRDLTYALFKKFSAHDIDIQPGGAASTWHFGVPDGKSNLVNTYTTPYFYLVWDSVPIWPDATFGVAEANYSSTIDRLNNFKNTFNTHVTTGVYDSTANNAAHREVSGSSTERNIYSIGGADLSLANYVYGFCYKYEYTVGDLTFIDRGPMMIVVPTVGAVAALSDVDEVRDSSVISIDYEGLSITNLPTLSNTSVDNYDTSNITLEIYRTIHNGSVLYLVDSVSNGTTSYIDRVRDADLQTRERAYITGGVVDNDPPPRAKCIHIVNDKAYYGNLIDTDGTDGTDISLPNQVRESIALDPDSVPVDFYANLPDAVVGISSYKSVPIVFCDNSVHRLEGGFDELGRGALVPQIISESVGCLSEPSIVRTEYGVFFAGTDGFYVTDGYQLQKISKDWNPTYLSWTATSTQKANIHGAYDPHQLRIWWGVTTTGSTNDKCVILDLNYPLGPTPTWTTASGGSSFSPTALIFSGRKLFRGDNDAYIFTHQDSNPKTDPFKNTAVAASSWSDQAIIYDYQSTLMDYGTAAMRKWAPWLHAQFHTSGNSFYCEPQAKVEAVENSWSSLAKADKNNALVWGDGFLQWGTSSYVWNEATQNFVAIKRAFPANSVRFTHRQVRFKLPLLLAHDSTLDLAESVAVSGSTVTVTGLTWPSYVVSWYISFSNEDYATQYQINRRNSDTVLTVTGTPTTGSGLSFKVYGYPKDVDFELLDFQITGAPLDKTQEGSRVWQS